MKTESKAPFPWFGGKSKAAELIWSRFGAEDLGNYVEPFLGSAAVFLRRPAEFCGWVTLNDFDGHLVNFWRSVSMKPEETAQAAASPVFECDLHARHLRLVREHGRLSARLMADPDYCEPTLAGWWAWGACVWIGSGWCGGEGPWTTVEDDEGVQVFSQLPHLGDGGTGVNRQLPHLGDGGTGVNRQLPHLGNGGTGVNRQLPHLGNGGKGVNRQLPHLGNGGRGGLTAEKLAWITDWFIALQDSFREARVACGDWQRICSSGTMTRNGTCAVLLDPPYSLTGAVYAKDSSTVSGDVRRWCIENGTNPRLRIALCGHDTEHNELESLGWTVETWAKGGGYQGKDDRERIWFSPACLKPQGAVLRFDPSG